jgi:hypothetical protein
MARITSKSGLTDYIKSQLGAPTINIEVTDDQISEIIDDTIQKFTEYAYGTLEDTVIVEFTGTGVYEMPDTITNIIKVSVSSGVNPKGFGSNFGNGFVPDMWSDQYFSSSLTGSIVTSIMSISATSSILDKFFGNDVAFNFNHLRKSLRLLENVKGAAVIHYQYEYIANDENDFVFNHEWIKAYSKAKTKELWSGVTGKFDQVLVGGARINYDKMAQEAERDIERLNEELLTKWSDPAPISIA